MKQCKNLHKWMKGKTVEKVDTSACNCTWIIFTDNTVVCLEAEALGGGLYGPVPYTCTRSEYDAVQQLHKAVEKVKVNG